MTVLGAQVGLGIHGEPGLRVKATASTTAKDESDSPLATHGGLPFKRKCQRFQTKEVSEFMVLRRLPQ